MTTSSTTFHNSPRGITITGICTRWFSTLVNHWLYSLIVLVCCWITLCRSAKNLCAQVAHDREGDSLTLEWRSLCSLDVFWGGGSTICLITGDLVLFIDEVQRTTMPSDRKLASVPITIEVVKISFPQGLVLISIIQLRYSKGCIKFF